MIITKGEIAGLGHKSGISDYVIRDRQTCHYVVR